MKYITYYTIKDEQNRLYYPASKYKIDYISSVIVRLGEPVTILSTSYTLNRRGIYLGRNIKFKEGLKCKQFVTYATNTVFTRKIHRVILNIKLLCYLLFSIKRNESILVYHLLEYEPIIILAKKLRKFVLILEVEEKYQNVYRISKKCRWIENKVFEMADRFIFSSECLAKIVNLQKKDDLIIYGSYKTSARITEKNDIFKCIYSGTFEEKKGGVYLAIEAAKYLNRKFNLIITGRGEKEEENKIKKMIEESNKENECKVHYKGFLSENEFEKLLNECHIGISSQINDEELTYSCFPSKILTYMGHGLNCVSSASQAVIESQIAEHVFLYYEDSGKCLAEAIRKAAENINFESNYSTVNMLNHEFEQGFSRMLK